MSQALSHSPHPPKTHREPVPGYQKASNQAHTQATHIVVNIRRWSCRECYGYKKEQCHCKLDHLHTLIHSVVVIISSVSVSSTRQYVVSFWSHPTTLMLFCLIRYFLHFFSELHLINTSLPWQGIEANLHGVIQIRCMLQSHSE